MRVLIAQALSSLGTSVTTVALAVMVFDLSGSVLQMGIVLAASALPLVVMSFVGGALLDRFDARRLMVTADLARACLIMAMPLAAQHGVGLIYLVAVLVGCFSAVFNPSQVKLVGDVATPNQLVKANSYLSVARDGAELGGYLVGGALVVSLGYFTTFLVDGFSYVVSALLLLGIQSARVDQRAKATFAKLLRQAPMAVVSIWGRPALRANLLYALVPFTFLMMSIPNSYGLALKVFDMGPAGFAAMEMVVAVGWIAGGILASRLDYKGDRNRYVYWSIIAMVACFAGVGLSRSFWLSVVFLALAAVANVGIIVGSMTLFQEIEPRPDKGRIIAIRAGFGQVATTLGLLAGGALGALVGIRTLFLVAAAGAALSATAVFVPYRSTLVRGPDEDEPDDSLGSRPEPAHPPVSPAGVSPSGPQDSWYPSLVESSSKPGARASQVPLRIGGMALENGLLLQTAGHWSAAVREDDGSIRVVSGEKGADLSGSADGRIPLVRGLARLTDGLRVIPSVKKKAGSAVLPFETRRMLGALGVSSLLTAGARRVPGTAAARETRALLLGLAPVLLALRDSDLASYHGAEHKAIDEYERGARGEDVAGAVREHDRCGSSLVAPLVVTTLAGNMVMRKVFKQPSPLAVLVGGLVSLGSALEIFRWTTRRPDSMVARSFSRSSYLLQHFFTTREPSAEQMDLARAALAELLRIEEDAAAR